MQTYSNVPRFNKAAIILHSLPADVVADIVDYIGNVGRTVVTDVLNDEAPPVRPLAIFSRSYISDQDFPEFYQGMMTLYLASMRHLHGDNDFYQQTLIDAFQIPSDMAKAIANRIESRDLIPSTTADGQTLPWYKNWYNRIAETVRRTVNWGADVAHLGLHNDQDQQFDTDFFDEVYKLGEAVEDLARRKRLIAAQLAVTQSMGLFKGDVDETGDVDAADELGDLFASSVQRQLPSDVYGGLRHIALQGDAASGAMVKDAIEGANAGRGGKLGSMIQDIFGHGNMKWAAIGALLANLPVLKGFVGSLLSSSAMGNAAGDVVNRLHDDLGPDVANAWASGDPARLYVALNDLDSHPMTTGDAELDEQIAGEVIAEDQERGDVYANAPEIGGIFKKLRTKWKMKQAVRQAGKQRHLMSQMAKKMKRQRDLEDATALRESAGYNPAALQMMLAETPTGASSDMNSVNMFEGIDSSGLTPYSIPNNNIDQQVVNPGDFGLFNGQFAGMPNNMI